MSVTTCDVSVRPMKILYANAEGQTCECLETQWRRTFRTLLVAARRIMNSLSQVRSELLKTEKEYTHCEGNADLEYPSSHLKKL